MGEDCATRPAGVRGLDLCLAVTMCSSWACGAAALQTAREVHAPPTRAAAGPASVRGSGTSTVAPRLSVDLVGDAAILSLAAGFGLLSQAIIGTGEIAPQTPTDPSDLLGIDRDVATGGPAVEGSRGVSDALFGAAFAYAAVDIVLTGALEDRPESVMSYAVVYLETMALNLAIGNLTKIAVRRPRPLTYHAARNGDHLESTNSSLSFYSMHTSFTAGIGATATYLAFLRGGDVEPWVVLGVSTLFTIGVALNRVLAHAHFPTDVIAGALAGAGIGVLVPHLHRTRGLSLRVGPGPGEAGLSVTGVF